MKIHEAKIQCDALFTSATECKISLAKLDKIHTGVNAASTLTLIMELWVHCQKAQWCTIFEMIT